MTSVVVNVSQVYYIFIDITVTSIFIPLAQVGERGKIAVTKRRPFRNVNPAGAVVN